MRQIMTSVEGRPPYAGFIPIYSLARESQLKHQISHNEQDQDGMLNAVSRLSTQDSWRPILRGCKVTIRVVNYTHLLFN